MGKGGWWIDILKQLPLKKLRPCHLVNLTFDLIAASYTLKFTMRCLYQYPLVSAVMWLFVMCLSLYCAMWACKQ